MTIALKEIITSLANVFPRLVRTGVDGEVNSVNAQDRKSYSRVPALDNVNEAQILGM